MNCSLSNCKSKGNVVERPQFATGMLEIAYKQHTLRLIEKVNLYDFLT